MTGFEKSYLLVADLQMPSFPVGTQPEFPPELVGEKFDKVFTTATLHWCSRDPNQALVNAHRMLRSGGRIVGEMGGYGNVEGVRAALHKVLTQRGINAAERDPWFFPSVESYTQARNFRTSGSHPLNISFKIDHHIRRVQSGPRLAYCAAYTRREPQKLVTFILHAQLSPRHEQRRSRGYND